MFKFMQKIRKLDLRVAFFGHHLRYKGPYKGYPRLVTLHASYCRSFENYLNTVSNNRTKMLTPGDVKKKKNCSRRGYLFSITYLD